MRHTSVLLVEHDPDVARDLEQALQREGVATVWARSASDGERAILAARPALLVLNPRLGPEDGWDVLRKLRRYQVPTLLLARGAAIERVALALGVDDCLTGAVSPAEVATRVRFLLQRTPPRSLPVVRFGDVALAPDTGTAFVGGRQVTLTPSEFGLLSALVTAAGRTVPVEQLTVRARGRAAVLPLPRSIEAHVRSLRRKLGDDLRQPRRVLSVRGFGYRLAAPDGASSTELAASAFEALPTPVLVIDQSRRVLAMNRAAETRVARPRDEVVGCLSCGELLGCPPGRMSEECPAVEPHAASSSPCLVWPVPGQPDRLVLELRG
jgi:DNA-binding response OmpR family regulator